MNNLIPNVLLCICISVSCPCAAAAAAIEASSNQVPVRTVLDGSSCSVFPSSSSCLEAEESKNITNLSASTVVNIPLTGLLFLWPVMLIVVLTERW